MPNILPILMLIIGLIIGGGAVWLIFRVKIQHEHDRGKSQGESERVALTERLNASQKEIDRLTQECQGKDQKITDAHTAIATLKAKEAQLTETIDQERKQAEEKLALVEDAQKKLSDAFKALASEALKSNNQSFLELAKTSLEKFQETAKGDLDKRQEAIKELMNPVKESLGKVDEKIREIEKAREGAYHGLRQQVTSLLESQKELRSETSNLVRALRRPQVRGRWGEIQLKRVVEMAGMLDHCDFYEQQSTDTEEGRLRPDLLVRLPGKRNIVVDSKAPPESASPGPSQDRMSSPLR